MCGCFVSFVKSLLSAQIKGRGILRNIGEGGSQHFLRKLIWGEGGVPNYLKNAYVIHERSLIGFMNSEYVSVREESDLTSKKWIFSFSYSFIMKN